MIKYLKVKYEMFDCQGKLQKSKELDDRGMDPIDYFTRL